VLAGALELRQREYKYGASLEKLVRTGATLSVAFDSSEIDTNSRFVGLRPQYKPEVSFSVTQPLLRNFGLDLTILLVRSAEASSNAAYYQYEAKLAGLIREVVESYWGVVQAKENVKVEEEGLRLAQTLEKENGARVKAGVLPPIAIKEAAAEAASREERVIVAANALSIATERLRLILQRNPDRAFVPRQIEPVDSPEVRTVDVDEQELIENAVARRPEVLRARYEIENRKILAKLRRNNLLPSLDLNASYGLNGLSGRGVPQVDLQTGETRVTPFTGDYGNSIDRMFSDDFNSYKAGVTLTVPLANATAGAEYVQGQIDLKRAELSYRQLLADVTLDVRKTIGDVRSNSKRITVTRLARELAEENLEQQQKRYNVGLATTKDILDFQEKLTGARAAESRALIDYTVSLAVLRQAEGTLLRQFDIVLEALPPTPTPLWAKF
jgi:outer membrane protein TolC